MLNQEQKKFFYKIIRLSLFFFLFSFTKLSTHSTYSQEIEVDGTPSQLYAGNSEYRDGLFSTTSNWNWEIQTVDCDRETGFYNSLAVDSFGYPHISYSSSDSDINKSVKYAYYDGNVWHIQTIDDEVGTGSRPSIGLDMDDNPHIVYVDTSNDYPSGELHYAYYNGSYWDIEIVDDSGYIGYPSLALGTNDEPYISYEQAEDLQYAYKDGLSWHTEIAYSSGSYGVGVYNSLAIDSNNQPHISFLNLNIGSLDYATKKDGQWERQYVDRVSLDNPHALTSGSYTSIKLDSNDYPHISYFEADDDDLRYTYYDGSTWKIWIMDGHIYGDAAGLGSSIYLDEDDTPFISYRLDGDVKFMWRDDTDWYWYYEFVDTQADLTQQTSLAMGPDGRLHLSYGYRVSDVTTDVCLAYASRNAKILYPTYLIFSYDITNLNLYVNPINDTDMWSLYESISWLTLSQTSGTGSAQVTATVDRTGLTPGTYTGTINAVVGGENVIVNVTMEYEIPPVDLCIVSVTPVQSILGEDLVLNKATAVEVKVSTDGSAPVNDVQVTLDYNGIPLHEFYVAEKENILEDASLEKPNALYPLSFDDTPETIIVYFFDSKLAPDVLGNYSVEATVEYENDTNPDNNTMFNTSVPVVETDLSKDGGEVRLTYFGIDSGSSKAVDELATPQFSAMFPLDESLVTSKCLGDVKISDKYRLYNRFNHIEYAAFWVALSTGFNLADSNATRYVGVVEEGWYSEHYPSGWFKPVTTLGEYNGLTPRMVLVEEKPETDITMHELGHSYGLRLGDTPEEYNEHPNGLIIYKGVDVLKRRLLQTSITSKLVYSIMGSYHEDYLNWIRPEDYQSILDKYKQDPTLHYLSSETERLLVSGTVNVTGTVELANWWRLPVGYPDDLDEGDWAVEFQDNIGTILYTQTFSPTFIIEGIPMEVQPFSFAVPFFENASVVRILHNGSETASRQISAHSPVVTIINPTGSETYDQHDVVSIQWSATDLDGDDLYYAVLYSSDNGSTWQALDVDLTLTEYQIPVERLTTGTSNLFKIIATDGVNTGEDISNAFTIRAVVYLPTVLRNYIYQPGVNHPPNMPSLPSPYNGAIDQNIDVNLSWTGGDPDGDSVTYDVFFEANDSTPNQLLCDDVSVPYCDPGILDYNTHYYWRVIARDVHGETTYSDFWDFTTKPESVCNINLDLQSPIIRDKTATIDGSVSSACSTITHINWQWGDGMSANQWFPASHTYAVTGTYPITVTAYNNLGDLEIVYATADVTPMGIIYSSIQLENVELNKSSFMSGETFIMQYDIANRSTETLTIPINYNSPSPSCDIGVIQRWLERLGDDKTIPPLDYAGRKGDWYAFGGWVIDVDACMMLPDESFTRWMNRTLTDLPLGDYRLYVEYKKLDADIYTVIQTETVDFTMVE